MPPPIRLNDSLSHGGSVVGTVSKTNVMGQPLAVVGDKCSCSVHGDCTISEGDPNWTIDGIPVALHGHKVSCGATLIASIGNFDRS